MLFPLTVAVIATNQPAGPLGSASPAAYGLTYRDVGFRTADGVRLSAWYIPPRNGAAVLVLPGSGSTRTAVLAQAAVLARHGYGTLLLDTRGHGLSGGHAMDFGWWGDRDIAAAVSFLGRQPGVHAGKIAVLGESMGGEQGLASGAPRPTSIPDSICAAAPRPVLIIAAGAVPSESAAARWFQAASPDTAHVWVVPHAGHTQGLATAPRAWGEG